jgi:hypothetical protein
MIPAGAENLTLNYSEDYHKALREKVGVEVIGKYGKIRVPADYIGEELVILIPKAVHDRIKARRGAQSGSR